ncbi:phage tail tape measure protein [uncultured Rothia sp.]|uniref:phage tail tape measure protein n=1 Tax=uncultured Rothia sp. TaxID=316088 RepID=UPI0025D1EDEB|nr:phage tail tape measure protein [uncultured Rothia sp.]
MSDESIKIDIDVNSAGAEKAARDISALEKQIGSLQSAVAALKAPSGRGGSVLDSLQLNSAKVKNMRETATALKSVADGLSSVSRAGDGMTKVDLAAGVDKSVSAYRRFVREMQASNKLTNDHIQKLKDTAAAMRDVASATNAMATAEDKAKRAQAALNQSQARKTEAQAEKLRAQATVKREDNAIPLQRQKGRDDRNLVKAKGNEAARLAEIQAATQLQQAELKLAGVTASAEAKREAAAVAASARIAAAREAEAGRTQRAIIKEQGSGERQAMRINASAAKSQLRANEQAIENVRYAARDTAVYYGAITAGLGTLVSAAVQAGIAQERAFADVKRTAQGTTNDLNELRKAYTDLSTQKVVTPFADLAKIGTLGAQMNIPTKDLKDFTTAVAEFSTVTEMDVEAATTAFGRFGQMMGGLQESSKGAGDGYKILANQVADLGAKSVATEPEIANMMVSIAAQGKSAGFTQNQILALSSTLSSLAIPKEWARGSLQRIFNSINAAAAEGGDAMHTYARAVGVTDAEFQKLWRDDPNKVFQGILQNLAGIGDKVQKAQAIKDLGFKNVRDVELLSRMSNSVGLYVEQLEEAERASKNTSFIDDSMSIITDTMSAKLQQFQNALQNAGAAMNSSFMVPMKAVVTVATMAVNAFAKLPAPIQAFVGALTAVGIARVGMLATKAALVSMSATYMQMGSRVMQATGQQTLSWGVVWQAVKQAQAGVVAYDGSLASNVGTANAAAAANQRLAASDSAVAVAAGKAAAAKEAQAAASAVTTGAQVAAGAGQAVGALSKLSAVGSGLMAMFGGPWGLAITGAITAASVAATYLGDSFTGASEKAENMKAAVGGSSAILKALAEDTKEVGSGAQTSFAELNATIQQNGQTLTSNGEALGYYVDKSGQVVQTTHAQAEAFGYSTLKIGEHTQALISDAIQGSDSFKNMSKDVKQALVDMGFSYAQYIKLATTSEAEGGGKAAADAYVDGYIAQLETRKNELIAKLDPESPSYATKRADIASQFEGQISALNEVKSQTEGVGGAMRDALNDAQLFGQEMTEAGDSSEEASFKIGDAKNEFKDLGEVLRSVLDEMFSSTDAAAALDSALQQVYESMQTNGTSMDPNSAEGQANIAAISDYFQAMGNAAAAGIEEMGLTGEEAYQYAQQSIQDTIDYLSAQGFDMSAFEAQRDTMAAIIAQPYQSGEVDHSATDASLNEMVGNAANAVSQAQGFLGKVQAIWQSIQGYMSQIGGAKSLSGKGSFTLGQKSKIRTPTFALRNNGKSAFSGANFRAKPQRSSGGGGGGGRRERAPRSGGGGGHSPSSRARKETKTAAEIFEDFLSRLKSALDKALQSWWRSTTAQDNYHKGLNSLRKDVENTTSKIKNLRKENEKLASDMRRAQQELHDAEFFHAVAVKYGDEERMQSTQTDIDEAKQKINEGQSKIGENSQEISVLQAGQFALKGYTEAAIANREALRSLQSQMIGLIEAYAAAGHSTQEIEAYTQSLKRQFIDQVTQLGYNQGEVTELAGAFDSLTGTIGQVPRDVRENVTDNGSVGATQGAIDGIHADPVTVPVQPSQSTITVRMRVIPDLSMALTGKRHWGKPGPWADGYQFFDGGLIPSRGFASGGLVPGRPPANPKTDNLLATNGNGLFSVRSGEYIISQPAVDFYGKGFMNALNTMQVPVMSGSGYSAGAGDGLVTINPAQFNELVRAVSTTVMLNGRAISKNIDSNNVRSGNRGVY